MQVNFNPQQNNQNFGMPLKVTRAAKEHLRKRNMPNADIEKLGKLIDRFEKKAISVTIAERDSDLVGHVWLDGKHSSDYREGFLSELFNSPIKFIEKVCKKAEKVDDMYNNNKLDEILK